MRGRRPATSEVPLLERSTPKTVDVAVGILTICFVVSEILLLPVGWPPSWIFDTRQRRRRLSAVRMFRTHVTSSCTYRERRVSPKPAKLLVLPVIRPPSWISVRDRRPATSEVLAIEISTPKTWVWPLEFCRYVLCNWRYAWGNSDPSFDVRTASRGFPATAHSSRSQITFLGSPALVNDMQVR